jgi:hypothetical protein
MKILWIYASTSATRTLIETGETCAVSSLSTRDQGSGLGRVLC